MTTPLVVYHKWCPDGSGAALAAYHKFGEDAFYKPAEYGEPFPLAMLDDNEVFVLDFSFTGAELDRAVRHGARSVLVLDHHEKTLEMLTKDPSQLATVRVDLEYAGAVLAWQHFHPDHKVPEMFLYLEDRDLWKWKLPMSKEISAGLRTLGGTGEFNKWFEIFDRWQVHPATTKDKLIELGRVALAADEAAVQMICSNAEVIKLGDIECLCVMTKNLHSEVGHALALKMPPMSATWHYKEDKKKYKVSLRSLGDFNVNVLAQLYGEKRADGSPTGGGHKNSAGFLCDRLPWKL